MREVTRIVTTALTAATLSLAAAMPLVAAWRTPASNPQRRRRSMRRADKSKVFRWCTDAAATAASARHRMIISPSHYERC